MHNTALYNVYFILDVSTEPNKTEKMDTIEEGRAETETELVINEDNEPGDKNVDQKDKNIDGPKGDQSPDGQHSDGLPAQGAFKNAVVPKLPVLPAFNETDENGNEERKNPFNFPARFLKDKKSATGNDQQKSKVNPPIPTARKQKELASPKRSPIRSPKRSPRGRRSGHNSGHKSGSQSPTSSTTIDTANQPGVKKKFSMHSMYAYIMHYDSSLIPGNVSWSVSW